MAGPAVSNTGLAGSGKALEYDVVQKIGHGSFGIIHKVKRKTDNAILCRKEINYLKMSQKERDQLHAEFSILSSLRHPNIVGYFHRDHLKSTQELHIYMEYCGGGDLSKVIRDLNMKNQYAEEEYVWSIFSQLVTALYRCHNGVDAPEVGNNVMGESKDYKPKGLRSKTQLMILHRDLKPENVFLSENNTVKLGDFGLSKAMASHDFASTYVGTPFYMSPEICAAERYTLHSDIWSLGCIIYELCAKKPPFNAKTHFQLVQRIKEGRFEPLPNIYSTELQSVIHHCLKTNPLHRPDTATLLQLPVVRLMRKQREVVELGRVLKAKEEQLMIRTKELEQNLSAVTMEKEKIRSETAATLRQEIEASLRLEWEVKARLEIDRQVQMENEKLKQEFDKQLATQLQIEIAKHLHSANTSRRSSSIQSTTDIPHSSIGTSTDTNGTPGTDLSSLSLESPAVPRPIAVPPKKATRTPFTRAKTQFDSPMDIQMGEASPMSIASLALSPRRLAAQAVPTANNNIFAAAAVRREKWEPHLLSPAPSEESDPEEADDVNDPPSPTRPPRGAAAALGQDPFKVAARRPGLARQSTAPIHRLTAQQPLFLAGGRDKTTTKDRPFKDRRSPPSNAGGLLPLTAKISPSAGKRHLSKGSPAFDVVSPTRRGAAPRAYIPTKVTAKAPTTGGDDMHKAVLQKITLGAAHANVNTTGGRTLVELQQARMGNGPVGFLGGKLGLGTVKESEGNAGEGGVRLAVRMLDGENRKGEDVAEWDPERDEMPSPFLTRIVKRRL